MQASDLPACSIVNWCEKTGIKLGPWSRQILKLREARDVLPQKMLYTVSKSVQSEGIFDRMTDTTAQDLPSPPPIPNVFHENVLWLGTVVILSKTAQAA